MARGKKTGGRDWVPGQPGGPGRPAVTPQLKQLKKLNAEKLAEILNRLAHATVDELKAISQDPMTSIFELTICAILKNAVQKGDQQRVNFLLDRLVGKPKEQVEHSTSDGFRLIIEDYRKKDE